MDTLISFGRGRAENPLSRALLGPFLVRRVRCSSPWILEGHFPSTGALRHHWQKIRPNRCSSYLFLSSLWPYFNSFVIVVWLVHHFPENGIRKRRPTHFSLSQERAGRSSASISRIPLAAREICGRWTSYARLLERKHIPHRFCIGSSREAARNNSSTPFPPAPLNTTTLIVPGRGLVHSLSGRFEASGLPHSSTHQSPARWVASNKVSQIQLGKYLFAAGPICRTKTFAEDSYFPLSGIVSSRSLPAQTNFVAGCCYYQRTQRDQNQEPWDWSIPRIGYLFAWLEPRFRVPG